MGGYRCWEEMDPGKLLIPRLEATLGTNGLEFAGTCRRQL